MTVQIPDSITHVPISDFFCSPDAPPGWHPATANPESWRAFRTAEVIWGYDPATKHAFLVYGRDALQAIAKFNEPREVACLAIDLNQASAQLEYLIALLETQRGQHDYRSSARS